MTAGLFVLIAGILAGLAGWVALCAFINWLETGRFRRAVRRG